jgi:hypothetical protein
VILEATPLHNAGLFTFSRHRDNDFAHSGASAGGFGLDDRGVPTRGAIAIEARNPDNHVDQREIRRMSAQPRRCDGRWLIPLVIGLSLLVGVPAAVGADSPFQEAPGPTPAPKPRPRPQVVPEQEAPASIAPQPALATGELWQGASATWNVRVTRSGNHISGEFTCYRVLTRDWSPTWPTFEATLDASGKFSALSSQAGGWVPRVVSGVFPRVVIEPLLQISGLECPSTGEISLQKATAQR